MNLKVESEKMKKSSGPKKPEEVLRVGSIEFIHGTDVKNSKPYLTDSNLSIFNNLLTLEEWVREQTIELESFIHAVSHDLRAPIRCINSFLQVLLKDYSNILDGTGKKNLETICNNAQKMGSLLEILLFFFITGHKELNKTKLNIEPIVDDVINEHKIYTQNELNYIRKESSLPAYGDRCLIKLTFSNLIFNAIKFSNKQSNPEIIIGSYNTENEIIYYVKDNGEGFEMEHAGKLFCPFQRLHKADEFEGTGIGLSIVERVIKGMEEKYGQKAKLEKEQLFTSLYRLIIGVQNLTYILFSRKCFFIIINS